MADTIITYLMGHAPDDDVQEAFVTLDADPVPADAFGSLTFRIYTPATELDPEVTVAEVKLDQNNWQADRRLNFDRVRGLAKFGAPLIVEATGFQSPQSVNAAEDPIWANVQQVAITLLFSKAFAPGAADPADIYREMPGGGD